MSIRLVTASCCASLSAGLCKLVDKANLAFFAAGGSYDDVNTTRYNTAFTPTAGITLQGVFIGLKRTGTTGTFTVALQENIGPWIQRAISAVTNVSSVTSTLSYLYVPFMSGYVATANQFRIAINCDTAGMLTWVSIGTDYFYALVGDGDDDSGYTSGDTLLLDNGVTFTMDENVTLSPTDGHSLILGQGSTFFVPNPSSAITLNTGTGDVLYSYNSFMKFGTSETRIDAGKLTWNVNANTDGYLFNWPQYGYYPPGDTSHGLEFYGAISDGLRLKVASDAYPLQKVVTTVEDIPDSWTNGDIVTICGKDTLDSDVVYYAITKGTKQVTLDKNIDVKVLQGAALLNITEASTRLGIIIKSTNQITLGRVQASEIDHLIFDGVYLENIAWYLDNNTPTASVPSKINNCMLRFSATVMKGPTFSNVGGFSSDNFHVINDTPFPFSAFNVKDATIVKFTGKGAHGGLVQNETYSPNIFGSNIAASDIIIGGGLFGASHGALAALGYDILLSDVFAVGGVSISSGFGFRINNLKQQRGYGTQFFNTEAEITNSTFGVGLTNNTTDIYHPTGFFSQVKMFNCNVGDRGVSPNISNTTPGTYLEIHQYNGTVGDNRTWKQLGSFVTDSPSYNNLRQTVNQASHYLSHQFALLSGDIANKKYSLIATCQLNNAAYYSGVYAHPKIDIYTDGIITTPCQTLTFADNDIEEHTYSQSFTPTTSNNQIILDFQTKTSALGSDADVLWSNVKVLQRIYGDVFISISLGITETLTYPIATISPSVSNAYITEATQATVDAYTGISIDHITQTLTITTNHSLKEVYDYTQSNLTTNVNKGYAEWFTTIDGVNYDSAYSIILNGCSLTGSGTIEMVSGKTFTKSNSGTYDGIIIYADGSREVHIALNGLVSGSTVQIYDNTGSTEIYNAIVNATSLDHVYSWTADHELRIRIRKAGYTPYEYTGNVTQTGFALNVSQIIDAVYVANNIDGSTVSEFYLHGSDIMIYVDDPDNATTAQRMYNWYMYEIATTTFIGIQPNDITAQTPWSYILADILLISNQSASPLFLSGANINNVSGNGHVIDSTSEVININGYFPFSSAYDVGTAVVNNNKILTVGKFIALK